MRKLVVIALLLGGLAVVANAQSGAIPDTMQSSDTLAIRIEIHMIGLQWTIDTIGPGYNSGRSSVGTQAVTYLAGTATSDTINWELGDATHYVYPCDSAFAQFKFENTGAVTMDIGVRSLASAANTIGMSKETADLDCRAVADTANVFLAFSKDTTATSTDLADVSNIINRITENAPRHEVGTDSFMVATNPIPTADADGIHMPAYNPSHPEYDNGGIFLKYVAPSSVTHDLSGGSVYHHILLAAKVSD